MLRKLRWIAIAVAVLVIAAPSGRVRLVLTAASSLSDLRGVDELKTLFNRDVGKVRLVLLVSPT